MYQPTRQQVITQWEQMPDILREAMHSSLTIDEIDNIQTNFHLSDDKSNTLARLIRGVFYGLIHTEDLYKEIKDSLQIDPRLALDIYHEVDKKIFESFRKEIEDNFIRSKIGAIKESEVPKPKSVPAQVVLKEGPEVINLKPESAVSETPTKLKVEGVQKPSEPAPMPIGQINIKPEPITVISSASPKPQFSPIAQQSKPPVAPVTPWQKPDVPSQPKAEPVGATEGPMIIHQKEESISVSQTQAASPFRQNSFGGYMGSFRSFSGQAPQAPVSSAKIEMPSGQKPVSGQTEQKIPVVIKKYEEEPAKTIHYSELKTPVTPKKESMPQTSAPVVAKKQPPEGMVNLSDLTFRK